MTTPTVHINAAGATLWVRKQDGHMREFNNASAKVVDGHLVVRQSNRGDPLGDKEVTVILAPGAWASAALDNTI
ncbi:hypothetical protein [Hydrogenophaga atypica]|uniref:Uncharacterized protein n=1 Tax=Hydrogenophaga atypica TaxID=249409 RepID=A0ABW2QSA2_9BURK